MFRESPVRITHRLNRILKEKGDKIGNLDLYIFGGAVLMAHLPILLAIPDYLKTRQNKKPQQTTQTNKHNTVTVLAKTEYEVKK